MEDGGAPVYRNHPHVYGEHKFVSQHAGHKEESSPCIWGAQFEIKSLNWLFRIIPMYMGSTINATS